MEAYKQKCVVVGCTHVVVKVGNPAVDFTLCKASIMHESMFFRAAFGEANFKEGNQCEMELKEEDPQAFLVFVKSMFPEEVTDFQVFPADKKSVYVFAELLRCADKYDAYRCSSIIHRIIKCIDHMCNINIDFFSRIINEAFVAACKYNLDCQYTTLLRKALIHSPNLFELKGRIPDDVFASLLVEQINRANIDNTAPFNLWKSYTP